MNRLKGAESRDWMAFRPALRKAIITNDLSMPDLVNVVANIVGVWPLVVSYLKETGRKDEGDSLGVKSFLVGNLPASWKCFHYPLLFLEKSMDGYLYHDQLARMKFRLFHLVLEIFKYHHRIVNMSRIGT